MRDVTVLLKVAAVAAITIIKMKNASATVIFPSCRSCYTPVYFKSGVTKTTTVLVVRPHPLTPTSVGPRVDFLFRLQYSLAIDD